MRSMSEKDVTKDHKFNGELYKALQLEEVEKVKELCATKVDEQGLHILTIHDDTVIHAATYSSQCKLVLDLLDALPHRHLDKMTRQNHQGNTILHDAATFQSDQSITVAEKMLEKAQGLLCMRNHLGETALFRSARYGSKDMFDFLARKISCYNEANQQLFLQRTDKTTVLHIAILAQHFDLALHIADRYRHLVGVRDAEGMTSLQLLSCNPRAFRREDKRGFLKQIINSVGLHFNSTKRSAAEKGEHDTYESALKLAKFLIERDTSWEATYPGIDQSKPRLHKYGGNNIGSAEKAAGEGPLGISPVGQGEQETGNTPIFLATKSGCMEIVEQILELYPQAIEHIDEKGRNILHVAIKYRQLRAFELVTRKGVPKQRLVRKVDNQGNSILHTVGIKVKDYTPETLRGPALELQEELLWHKRVKEVTPPQLIDHRNNMKQTAEGLFATTNSELRTTATEWLKRTSEGCTVVAVLIATVAFAAAYTVPGGPNNQTGVPVLLDQPLFVVFTVSDVLSLSFALTSVVIFLSIVTSPFRLADFKDSLPTKLMLGFTFLFLSVSMMMIAFAATVLLMIRKRESWTKVVLYALSFLPVGIFAFSYFPLYLSLSETYKYFLKKGRQAIPWRASVQFPSRPTNWFGYYRTQTSNSSNLPRPQSTRPTRHNWEMEDLCSEATPQTPNFSV